jgi:predicted MFS family arabinose efflux permease
MNALVRQNPGFGRLWAAAGVSQVGDWLSFVAVAMLAMKQGGDAFGLALVFAAHAVPGALLSPVAGALVDGLDRRRVLIAADLLAAAVTLTMMFAALSGMVAAVPLLLLVRSGISAIAPAGESAAVRRLVRTEDLIAANSALAATWSIAFVTGMAMGGFAALLGPALALGLDVATFLVSAVLHATLPAMPSSAKRRSVFAIIRDTPGDTLVALRAAAAHRPLLQAVLGKAPFALATGPAWVALNMLGAIAQPFGSAEVSFGVLQAIRGAGTGIGPLIAGRLAKRGVSERTLEISVAVLSLVSIAGLAFARSPWVLGLVCLAWGTGVGANWVLMHASLQRLSSDAIIGRLAAFDELLVTIAMTASALAGAAVITWIGLAEAPLLGAALGVLGLLAAAAVVRLCSGRNIGDSPRP